MKRIYTVPDDRVVGHSGNVRKNLIIDLPDFTGFDPDLNEAKAQELKATEEAALAVGTHEQFQAKSKMLTERVTEAMEKCHEIARNFRYFSEKNFSDQPAFLSQFGMSTFAKEGKNQGKAVLLFSAFANAVQNNREKLVAGGVKEELLDSIAPAAEQLTTANAEQDAFINTEKVDTRKRSEAFNHLWKLLGQFSKASAIIHKDRPDKRSIYTLPTNGSSASKDENPEDEEKDDQPEDKATE